ncbi:tripartite motif-containing protein 42-like isoform X1 [Alosa sapidissima]|uniref:tripartite motif-containing protein 42-like isoform X1 n=2 Tax=Alosa sapidissima TaxID=34773 RepID=UPI001C081DF4|nr:tripartite motif-containing protein 42-like isoform X1 [Alosa sapidissima]
MCLFCLIFQLQCQQLLQMSSDSKSTMSCWGHSSAQKLSDSCNKAGDTSSSGSLSQACTPGRQLHRELSVVLLPLAELLCCPGCGTFLQHPISLPCGHCLCLACLATLRKKKARELAPTPTDSVSINATPALVEPLAACPRCQASYPLLPGAWSFPANVLLAQTAQKLVGAHPELRQLQRHVPLLCTLGFVSTSSPCPLPVAVGRRPAPCELCSKRRPAQNYCATCRLHYCAKCLRKLHGNPAYSAHTLAEPVQEEERELCPVHPEHSLTHFCQSDGTLGCHDCMVQSDSDHHGHLVAPLSEARTSSEAVLCQALEHASMVQQQCDSDSEQMEALAMRVSSGSAELRRSIRNGFLSLRNALFDQEAALLSHLDALSSSTDAVAQAFLQHAGPLRRSLTGLREISKQALLEPRASVFLQGATGLARWLSALSAEMPRPDTHLLPAGYQPLAGAELHFDELLHDLQSLMGKHLRWRPTDADTVVMPTSIAKEMIGEEAGEKEPDEEEQEEVGIGGDIDVEADVVPRPDTPLLGSGDEEESLVMEEDLGMPAGDGATETKSLLLPRPPIIYQHNAYGTTMEVFWMVPMGEDVHSFDVHFQDASMGVASGRGVVTGGVKGCSLQTSGLRHDTQYLFRARSVNEHGHGAWSSIYRVNTGRSEEGEKEQRTNPAQEA